MRAGLKGRRWRGSALLVGCVCFFFFFVDTVWLGAVQCKGLAGKDVGKGSGEGKGAGDGEGRKEMDIDS